VAALPAASQLPAATASYRDVVEVGRHQAAAAADDDFPNGSEVLAHTCPADGGRSSADAAGSGFAAAADVLAWLVLFILCVYRPPRGRLPVDRLRRHAGDVLRRAGRGLLVVVRIPDATSTIPGG
jgi:hypothetical protein